MAISVSTSGHGRVGEEGHVAALCLAGLLARPPVAENRVPAKAASLHGTAAAATSLRAR